MKKYATQKDIASALNISKATVSRALADRWDVNAETRKLVMDEAKRQNYKPNPIAHLLKSNRTYTIGLVIPELLHSFFPKVIIGIQSVLEEHGFQSIITHSNESVEKEAKNLNMLENNMVEGILISVTKEAENSDYYQRLIDSGIPIVFFNRVCSKVIAPKVVIDDYKMAFFATEHLIYNKFNKIFHFAGPENLSVSKERKRGFLDAMKKHKKEITENSVITSGVLSDKGFLVMNSLIKNNNLPDAIFCFNDTTAFGAYKAMKEAGLKCPDDIALVGFSETETATIIDPTLTSVEQPTYEIGATAARLLLEQIMQTPPPEPETICLHAKLNVRESSANVRFSKK